MFIPLIIITFVHVNTNVLNRYLNINVSKTANLWEQNV